MRNELSDTQDKGKKKPRISKESWYGLSFFILISVLIYVVYSGAYYWISRYDKKVTNIELTGNYQYTKNEDIEYLLLNSKLLNSYLSLDVNLVKRRLMELPWVKDVVVKKQFPSTIVISLEEYKPIYRWQDLYYLDESGHLFSIPKVRMEKKLKLPKLYGVEGKYKEIVLNVNEFRSQLKNNKNKGHYELLIAIEDARSSWQLLLKSCEDAKCTDSKEIKIELGSKNILQRFERFTQYFEVIRKRSSNDKELIKVDLRNDSGIIIEK